MPFYRLSLENFRLVPLIEARKALDFASINVAIEPELKVKFCLVTFNMLIRLVLFFNFSIDIFRVCMG